MIKTFWLNIVWVTKNEIYNKTRNYLTKNQLFISNFWKNKRLHGILHLWYKFNEGKFFKKTNNINYSIVLLKLQLKEVPSYFETDMPKLTIFSKRLKKSRCRTKFIGKESESKRYRQITKIAVTKYILINYIKNKILNKFKNASAKKLFQSKENVTNPYYWENAHKQL